MSYVVACPHCRASQTVFAHPAYCPACKHVATVPADQCPCSQCATVPTPQWTLEEAADMARETILYVRALVAPAHKEAHNACALALKALDRLLGPRKGVG